MQHRDGTVPENKAAYRGVVRFDFSVSVFLPVLNRRMNYKNAWNIMVFRIFIPRSLKITWL